MKTHKLPPRTRVEAAMRMSGISQTEMAKRLGITQSAVQQIASGKTQGSKVMADIARELDVSLYWLRGETDDATRVTENYDMSREDVEERFGIVRLPTLDVSFAMGPGSFLEDNPDISWTTYDSTWLQTLSHAGPRALFVATGTGDSMVPTLLDNDMLIFDRSRHQIDQQDRLWAIAYGDLGMVKRIRRQPSGRFLIISDNPAVDNFEADASDVHVIGRVVWIGRKA